LTKKNNGEYCDMQHMQKQTFHPLGMLNRNKSSCIPDS
jgi:hypothetical protein